MLAAVACGVSAAAQSDLFNSPNDPDPRGRIDELVFNRLKSAGIQPAKICSDSVFIRRAFLDLTGTIPTAEEARAFLKDTTPDKRAVLIDGLMERPEFADYWAMRWCDLLRVKAEFPVNLWPNAVQAYHRWIRDCIRDNKPYDRFARELLTTSGSNFRAPAVNFYRSTANADPISLTHAVALTFMGSRADKWPEEKQAGMAAFFTKIGFKTTGEWKEEIILYDPLKVCTNPAVASSPVFPDGTPSPIPAGKDPREVFADWLISAENPWFTRAIVNRVWYWMMGRGIVHEPDDIRPDNPPSNPELLARLETEMMMAQYDMRQLFRLIMNSQTYQLSPVPASDHPKAEELFAFYPIRRVEAEVLIDMLCTISGTTEEYESPIPEPFTFIPRNTRAVQLADGSITSSFLELFGRPSRDTGIESERNNKTSSPQRLHLLNSSHVRSKIEASPKLNAMFSSGQNPREIATRLYLTFLSRYPTEEELDRITSYDAGGSKRARDVAIDLAWTMINSMEFLYRH